MLTVVIADNGSKLQLSGTLGEQTTEVLAGVQKKLSYPLTIDLQGIEYINSVGIVQWVHFLRSAGNQGPVSLINCSPTTVNQINMNPSFSDRARIESVYRFIQCTNCNFGDALFISINEKMPPETAPLPVCKKCGSEMDVEESDDDFFNFLKTSHG